MAEKLHDELEQQGISTLLDDRDERPGAKFKDADLLGIPYRITVGKRFSEDGLIELRRRSDGVTQELPAEDILRTLNTEIVEALR
jgi:prolyl-tRNA synthetase